MITSKDGIVLRFEGQSSIAFSFSSDLKIDEYFHIDFKIELFLKTAKTEGYAIFEYAVPKYHLGPGNCSITKLHDYALIYTINCTGFGHVGISETLSYDILVNVQSDTIKNYCKHLTTEFV